MNILYTRDNWEYMLRDCHLPCVWFGSEHRQANKNGEQRK